MLNITKHKPSQEPTVIPPASRGLSPFEEMERYFSELEERMFGRGWFQPIPWSTRTAALTPVEERTPLIDVIDRDDIILVKSELPGIEKKDLDISMSGNTITIKAECSHGEKEETGEYYHREIGCGSFSRSIQLPSTVNIEKAKAKFTNGILELTLPKIEKTTRRKIKIE